MHSDLIYGPLQHPVEAELIRQMCAISSTAGKAAYASRAEALTGHDVDSPVGKAYWARLHSVELVEAWEESAIFGAPCLQT